MPQACWFGVTSNLARWSHKGGNFAPLCLEFFLVNRNRRADLGWSGLSQNWEGVGGGLTWDCCSAGYLDMAQTTVCRTRRARSLQPPAWTRRLGGAYSWSACFADIFLQYQDNTPALIMGGGSD